jgi:hypothetical protein
LLLTIGFRALQNDKAFAAVVKSGILSALQVVHSSISINEVCLLGSYSPTQCLFWSRYLF